MEKVEIKPGVYWVGGIDWDIREFHGYVTPRGTTYNAYLIVDEKVVLVDTVKHYLFGEMLARIKEVVDPARIDYIVSNHVEMDHSGSLPAMKQFAPDAKILTSVRGDKGLRRHYKEDLGFQVVQSGDSLSIGKRTLKFVHIPMVHWPDSMVTYIPEQRLLLPNDAFGQHIASAERYDDEVGWAIVKEEAARYYANIVMPYGDQVKKAMAAVSGLQIDMIAPSHGIIWRRHIPDILAEYAKWADNQTEHRALIVYDSMWGTTERMAYRLWEGLQDAGVPAVVRNLKTCHISDVVADLIRCRAVLLGSPTLNNGILPSMGAFLTYVRGLRPKNRIGYAFGSYGWGGKPHQELEAVMKELGWEVPIEGTDINFVPDEPELDAVRETGRRLGALIKK
jgi:flavorubredoxin